MVYKWIYETPINFSDIIIISDGEYLTGLYFKGAKNLCMIEDFMVKKVSVIEETIHWLDIYFSGQVPTFIPKYRIGNLTPFRKDVYDIMNSIPFGGTLTYGDIAEEIAAKRNIEKMSSQAVGGAISNNPICIIIPCHRVVGANGNITGYSGGINNKIELLKHEGVNVSSLTY